MRDVLKLAGVAPAADDAVGCAWVDAEGGGCLCRTLTAGLRGTGVAGGWFSWWWPRMLAGQCRLSGV